MALLDSVTGLLRSALGMAESEGSEALSHTPMQDARLAEEHLKELVGALHRAADSAEREVEVVEGLAHSLPPLTEAVTVLSGQITELMAVLAPLAAVENRASRVEHLFGRRRHGDEPPPDA